MIAELFKNSCDTLFPYLDIEGGDEKRDCNTPAGRKDMEAGISGLEKVLHAVPDHWSARWVLGKAYQAQGNHEMAWAYFRSSHQSIVKYVEQNPEDDKAVVHNSTVLRELSIESLLTDRYTESLYYSRMAIELSPDDPTLWVNLALSYLLNNDLENATTWVQKALTKLTDDVPARNIMRIIDEIRAGRRKMPRQYSELED